MIRYTPTFLAITKPDEEIVVKFELGADSSYSVLYELVSYKRRDEGLVIEQCDFPRGILRGNSATAQHTISYTFISKKDSMEYIATCAKETGGTPAFRFTFGLKDSGKDSVVGAEQAIIIPVYTEIGSPFLAKESVLGERSNLISEELSCGAPLIFDRRPISCTISLRNLSQSPIMISVYARQSFEQNERVVTEKIVLVPNQDVAVGFQIPDENYFVGSHSITTTTSASSISGEGSSYIEKTTFEFTFIPWYILLLTIGLIIGFFAILSKKLHPKLYLLTKWLKKIPQKRRK